MAGKDNQEKEIVERLDTIIRLLADVHPQLQEIKTSKGKIAKLLELGVSDEIIADVAETTVAYVRVVRHRVKKEE